jgi:hypothetical protein
MTQIFILYLFGNLFLLIKRTLICDVFYAKKAVMHYI